MTLARTRNSKIIQRISFLWGATACHSAEILWILDLRSFTSLSPKTRGLIISLGDSTFSGLVTFFCARFPCPKDSEELLCSSIALSLARETMG